MSKLGRFFGTQTNPVAIWLCGSGLVIVLVVVILGTIDNSRGREEEKRDAMATHWYVVGIAYEGVMPTRLREEWVRYVGPDARQQFIKVVLAAAAADRGGRHRVVTLTLSPESPLGEKYGKFRIGNELKMTDSLVVDSSVVDPPVVDMEVGWPFSHLWPKLVTPDP